MIGKPHNESCAVSFFRCNFSEYLSVIRTDDYYCMNVSDYNTCVDEHADGLFRFIFKHMKDEEQARDVVQDAFEKMWLKVSEINAEKAKSYLFTTAYRTMIDQFRRNSKKQLLEDAHMKELKDHNQYSDLNEILHEALEKLPEIQKSVVLLRDYEGYNYKEIGEITNLSESQVKVYIFRARKTLKEYLVSIDYVI